MGTGVCAWRGGGVRTVREERADVLMSRVKMELLVR